MSRLKPRPTKKNPQGRLDHANALKVGTRWERRVRRALGYKGKASVRTHPQKGWGTRKRNSRFLVVPPYLGANGAPWRHSSE